MALPLIMVLAMGAMAQMAMGQEPEDLVGQAPKLVSADATGATMTMTTVEGQPFTQAIDIQSTRAGQTPWSTQLAATNGKPVAKGDVLLASLWMQTVKVANETGEGRTAFVMEINRPPNDKSIDMPVMAAGQWTRFDIPFVARRDYAAGEASLLLRLGYPPQHIRIAEWRVVNYHKTKTIKDLPRTSRSYPGRDASAAWRVEAERRIEKIRKGDLTVEVVGPDGKPASGADVSVRMRRHAFGFGSAISAAALLKDSPDGEQYREKVAMFSRVVFENDLKWPYWNRQQVLLALDWLEARKILARGHCLVWPSWRNTPADLKKLADDPQALRQRINDHITEIVSAYRGRLVDWDVINEVESNHNIVDILGEGCMVEWFKTARAADPDVHLYINDYSILAAEGRDTRHQDAYEKTIRYLQAQGAPIDGIGLQSHFGAVPTPPVRLLEILDRFAALGLRLSATEFDIDTTDELLQADYTRDFLTVLFSHEAVDAILMWGFWEGRHWRADAALWRRDWSIKPNGTAWVDLVTQKWWTNDAGKAGADGKFATRGFLGDYEIEAIGAEGRGRGSAQVSLRRDGTTVRIELK